VQAFQAQRLAARARVVKVGNVTAVKGHNETAFKLFALAPIVREL
jgi:hypothetical protein